MNTIEECLLQINECSIAAIKMRAVVTNTQVTTELRYRAAVIEEAHLELIQRLLKKIEELKEILYVEQECREYIHRYNSKDGQ